MSLVIIGCSTITFSIIIIIIIIINETTPWMNLQCVLKSGQVSASSIARSKELKILTKRTKTKNDVWDKTCKKCMTVDDRCSKCFIAYNLTINSRKMLHLTQTRCTSLQATHMFPSYNEAILMCSVGSDFLQHTFASNQLLNRWWC